jgi:SSS family solute:Na+ symporter
MAVGSVLTLGLLILYATGAIASKDGVYANEPIYYGLGASLVCYVIISLLTPATPTAIRAIWDQRVAGAIATEVPLEGVPEKVSAGR